MIFLISNQQQIQSEDFQVCDLNFCIEYIKTLKEIGLDIETTRKYNKYFDIEGLDPYTSNIVMLQVGDLDCQFIIDTRSIDAKPVIETILENNITIIGHNLAFEYSHILHNYGLCLKNMYDTMLVEKIIYNGIYQEMSLKKLIERYLKISVNKETRLEFLDIGAKPFTISQIIYGAEDIIYPLKIKSLQKDRIVKYNLKNTVNLEHRFLPVKANIEYKGIGFDKEAWVNLSKEKTKEFLVYKEKLNNFVISNSFNLFIESQLDLFNSEPVCNINWGSSKQVIEFFCFLNICPKAVSKTTKKLSYTVESKEVKMLLNLDLEDHIKSFIRDYITYKELEQSITTFGEKFLKYVNPITNRIHTSYNQIVNTGRISSRSPNNQNIPSDSKYRQCFIAPDNYFFANADYSGQESIILVNKSLDKDLLAFYDNGLNDMHSYVAKLIFKEELDTVDLNDVKELRPGLRQISKSVGFALAYGGDGHTIATNLGMPPEKGKQIYEAYFKAFPGLASYFDIQKRNVLNKGFIVIDNITKRKFFPPFFNQMQNLIKEGRYKEANKIKSSIERLAMNYPIQGEAGSITKYAAVLLHEFISENNLQDLAYIVLLVHDEIVVETHESIKDLINEKLQFFMEKSGKLWCKRVELKAEAVLHKTWQH